MFCLPKTAWPPTSAVTGSRVVTPVTSGGEDHDDLVAARTGDRAAFNRLVRKYQRRVYVFCHRMVNDSGEAEDLAQEVFVKVYDNIGRFREESKFSTWLYQIAKNLCLNRLKYLKRRSHFTSPSLDAAPAAGTEALAAEVADEGKDPQSLAENRELQDALRRQIDALQDEYRTALVLRDIEGLSYEEIAEITQVPEGTVKSRIHRARNVLKEGLEEFWK